MSFFDETSQESHSLKRCTKCLLPETFPYIEYDDEGVCNFCKSYEPVRLSPMTELLELAEGIRSDDGKHDCIVMFSGGRDSSFLLHYVVRELGLHPLAFTYDWGMTTPVGERNAAKMCEILGVDRIIVDGGTKKKLRNIQKNVLAWSKAPALGMVPLFMAGDKHFLVEVNKIARRENLHTIFIGTNQLEKTHFKTGFCGVSPREEEKKVAALKLSGKLTMIRYYVSQFLKNPSYINGSLWETMTAFFSFYASKQTEIDLYKYVMWNEDQINELLIHEYEWELAPDSSTTWRIGDGTAAFYNYIYHTVAGFTENDSLRSNQIREGQLSREEALCKLEADNRTRPDSIMWYLARIGVNPDDVLTVINGMKKLYQGER